LNSSIVFGPVPSRRLGRSLGVNNIPPKRCSYSCLYCQLGRTTTMQVVRGVYHQPSEISRLVGEKVKRVREAGGTIDYITLVTDGEPTLDANLGQEIELLRATGIKIAVITNASLVWRDDVREDLGKADWVSVKVDATAPEVWRRVNRPHGSLKLSVILEGITAFARAFKGILATETMLVRGINDDASGIRQAAGFLEKLEPDIAYLAAPTRPPAERVEPATESALNEAYHIFAERLGRVEYLIGYEGNAFAASGDAAADLLSITAVHPMRQEAVRDILEKAGAGWSVVERLIAGGQLAETEYQGRKFYVRRLSGYNKK